MEIKGYPNLPYRVAAKDAANEKHQQQQNGQHEHTAAEDTIELSDDLLVLLTLLDEIPINKTSARAWYFRNAFQINMTLVINNARQITTRLKQRNIFIPIEIVMEEIKKRNADLFRGNMLEAAGQTFNPYGYQPPFNNASAFIPLKLLNEEDKAFLEACHAVLVENTLDLSEIEKIALVFAKEKWRAKKDQKPSPLLNVAFLSLLLEKRNEDPVNLPTRVVLEFLIEKLST